MWKTENNIFINRHVKYRVNMVFFLPLDERYSESSIAENGVDCTIYRDDLETVSVNNTRVELITCVSDNNKYTAVHT